MITIVITTIAVIITLYHWFYNRYRHNIYSNNSIKEGHKNVAIMEQGFYILPELSLCKSEVDPDNSLKARKELK